METGSGSTRGSYVQDCGYPMVLNWLTEARYGLTGRLLVFALRRFWAQRPRQPVEPARLGPGPRLRRRGDRVDSMPLLGMGRDVPDGILSLNKRGYLASSWNTRASKPYFDGLRQQMQAIADALYAEGLDDSLWAYFRRSITVHPVGGAPMGRTSTRGCATTRARCSAWTTCSSATAPSCPARWAPTRPSPSPPSATVWPQRWSRARPVHRWVAAAEAAWEGVIDGRRRPPLTSRPTPSLSISLAETQCVVPGGTLRSTVSRSSRRPLTPAPG